MVSDYTGILHNQEMYGEHTEFVKLRNMCKRLSKDNVNNLQVLLLPHRLFKQWTNTS